MCVCVLHVCVCFLFTVYTRCPSLLSLYFSLPPSVNDGFRGTRDKTKRSGKRRCRKEILTLRTHSQAWGKASYFRSPSLAPLMRGNWWYTGGSKEICKETMQQLLLMLLPMCTHCRCRGKRNRVTIRLPSPPTPNEPRNNIHARVRVWEESWVRHTHHDAVSLLLVVLPVVTQLNKLLCFIIIFIPSFPRACGRGFRFPGWRASNLPATRFTSSGIIQWIGFLFRE